MPADHGYPLYSALCRLLPWLHEDGEIGVHPVPGVLTGNRLLALTPASRLTFRVPSERIGQLLPLAGKNLEVDGHEVRVGVPRTLALRPAASLRSRLVVIKGFMEPEPFLGAARRQLEELGVKGTPGLLRRTAPRSLERKSGAEGRSPFVRRTLRIRDKMVVGYAMQVGGLTAEESVRLQEAGLGGRRRFGCGIFVPSRTETR